MLKMQKKFSPLECGICKEYDCPYKLTYMALYNAKLSVSVVECKRIKELKRKSYVNL